MIVSSREQGERTIARMKNAENARTQRSMQRVVTQRVAMMQIERIKKISTLNHDRQKLLPIPRPSCFDLCNDSGKTKSVSERRIKLGL